MLMGMRLRSIHWLVLLKRIDAIYFSSAYVMRVIRHNEPIQTLRKSLSGYWVLKKTWLQYTSLTICIRIRDVYCIVQWNTCYKVFPKYISYKVCLIKKFTHIFMHWDFYIHNIRKKNFSFSKVINIENSKILNIFFGYLHYIYLHISKMSLQDWILNVLFKEWNQYFFSWVFS